MTDFDLRLSMSLERLDAAIPAVTSPDFLALRAQSRRRRRPRRIVPALVAAALLIGAGGVAADRVFYPDNPEPELEAALANAWAGEECVLKDDAAARAQAALDGLGKSDWQVIARPGAGQGTGCTFPAVIATTHEVILIGGAGADLAAALGALQVETFEQCLNRIEARTALSSVLAAHGVTHYDIHDGPELLFGTGSVPIDHAAEYIAHAKHCWLYGGMGADETGKPWFRLWGPWP